MRSNLYIFHLDKQYFTDSLLYSMPGKTPAELASLRGDTKVSNYTGKTLILVFSGEHLTIVRKATQRRNQFGIDVGGRGSGGLSSDVSSSEDTEYFASQVHELECLDYKRDADTRTDGNDDSGRGIMYYIGPKKGDRFYMTVFIDGTPRLINKGFRGGNSIVFQANGQVTFRDEMNFNGKHPQTSCGQWHIPVAVQVVEQIPSGFMGLQVMNTQR